MVIHNRQPKSRRTPTQPVRRASVLVVVLVVIMLLALGSYTFTQIMLGELKSTESYERDVKSRAYADSGIELVAAVLGEKTDEFSRPNLYDNPGLFRLVIHDSESPRSRGSFNIVAPRENNDGTSPIRYGLVDESSKLNLNSFISFFSDEDEQQDVLLLAFPNMTPDIADAILDWLDDNEEPRPSGAENEYYGTLYPPYEAKNGRLESLDELLRVRGVTSELLFGEDTNRNGLLDPNENDGEASMPYDNADGTLDRGWAAHLTVLSREANRRADGELKIDVNQEDLVALYDAVEEAFDSDAAKFVTAYRLNGPDEQPGGNSGSPAGSGQQPGGRQSGGQSSGQAGGGSRTASGGETRGGLNLAGGGSQTLKSLYELVDATVTAEVNGMETTLESPWKDEPASIEADLPTLLDRLTTSSEAFIEGRVNIARASRQVLMAILSREDEETEPMVEAIIGAQATDGSTGFDTAGRRSTTGWLLAEDVIDLEQMRQIAPRITSRGDVYRVQSVGYFDAGGPATRLEAIIDATQTPPAIVSIRDLTELGAGYALQPQQP